MASPFPFFEACTRWYRSPFLVFLIGAAIDSIAPCVTSLQSPGTMVTRGPYSAVRAFSAATFSPSTSQRITRLNGALVCFSAMTGRRR